MGPLVKIKFLGQGFNKWVFPSVLILMILGTACDCMGRLMNCIGLKQFAFDEQYAEEKMIEGKAVIERYHKRRRAFAEYIRDSPKVADEERNTTPSSLTSTDTGNSGDDPMQYSVNATGDEKTPFI